MVEAIPGLGQPDTISGGAKYLSLFLKFEVKNRCKNARKEA